VIAEEFVVVKVTLDEFALVLPRLLLAGGEVVAADDELGSMTCGGVVPWNWRCSSRPRSMTGSRISQGRSANITICAPSLAADMTESSLEATA
jgi:hypothetical protein